MADNQLSTETKPIKEAKTLTENEKSLKGTLVSVGLVGSVIVGMWIAVFWIYMARI